MMMYKDRYNLLWGMITHTSLVPYFRLMSVNNLPKMPDQTNFWKEFVKENEMEGIVVKNPNHTNEWVKLKNFDEDDFTIVGTELKAEGKARGWFISNLILFFINGTHLALLVQFVDS
jgi:ATP-dependent DNA ligase